jgi:integrase
VDTDDLLQVVARLVHDGKMREAAKLRSYLRAAYAAAIAARHDPAALPKLRELRLSANPARDLATIEGNSEPGERNLSLAELRCYWCRISAPGFYYGPLLRFHLLTGAQRIAQLSRATRADFDPDTKIMRLYDRKGRRKKPREHDVPLIPEAIEAMESMGEGPYLFTLRHGASPAGLSGIGDALDAVNEVMSEAGELPGGRFTARDLRRTVETRLSAEGVSIEDRSHLQSHGLSGVQHRHYDKHKRVNETRAALEKLRKLLEPRGQVLPFKKSLPQKL